MESDNSVNDEFQGNELETDREVFIGGPLVSELQSWKKQFAIYDRAGKMIHEGQVFLTSVSGGMFVWRCLSRIEYKRIVATPNTDPLQREELICETAVLWPPDYDYQTMAGGPAGVPAMLSQQIMVASGFDEMNQPVSL